MGLSKMTFNILSDPQPQSLRVQSRIVDYSISANFTISQSSLLFDASRCEFGVYEAFPKSREKFKMRVLIAFFFFMKYFHCASVLHFPCIFTVYIHSLYIIFTF